MMTSWYGRNFGILLVLWTGNPVIDGFSSQRSVMQSFGGFIIDSLNMYTDGQMCGLWHDDVIKFSTLLAICEGNSPVSGEFPAQRPVTRSFDIFFDLRLNKRLSKQSLGWWFETLSCPLWRQCNEMRRQNAHPNSHYSKLNVIGLMHQYDLLKGQNKITYFKGNRY